MEQLYVRDIMTAQVITLARDTAILDAADILSSERIGGAPVMDGGRIIGLISKSDLVESSAHHDPANAPKTVADVMVHLVFAVRPRDPAMQAVRLMVEEGIHRTVVVDEKGRLAGIVSAMDVLRALARGKRLQAPEEEATDYESHAEAAVAVQYVDLREYQGSF